MKDVEKLLEKYRLIIEAMDKHQDNLPIEFIKDIIKIDESQKV